MKNVNRVTILGSLIALALAGLGCALGGKEVPAQPPVAEVQPLPPAVDVRERMEQAARSYQAGELAEVRSLCEEVLRVDPNNATALEYRDYLQKVKYCTVYPGDTLSNIAQYYYGDREKWTVVARANNIADPKKLRAYQRLKVLWFPGCDPGKDELGRLQGGRLRGVRVQKIVVYPVRKGDTLRALARRTYRTEQLSHFLADYNGLASLDPPPEGLSLKIPVLTGVPASVRAETGQEVLRVAQQRRTNQEYEEACRQLAAIPEGAPAKAEADRQLALCRAEGESYFLRLGDQAFQASDPRKACQYWEKVLVLNPANQEARKKLEEAKDLMATLDRLPALREPVH